MINTVVFQTEKTVWVYPRDKREEFVYENEITPTRMCVTNTTDEFRYYISQITKEDLFNVLIDELNRNELTIYSS